MRPAFADDLFVLYWEPIMAEVSASGDLGFTVGTYEGQQTASDAGAALTRGKYVTIWQKNAVGEWKVLLDTGVPDVQPEQD